MPLPFSLSAARGLDKIRIHFDLLLKWNRKISLTTITSPDVAARQLYFEPIFASTFIEPDISSAADVGSGGGFPGLPFSFMRPDLMVTLIEADRRKTAFLGEARRLLGSKNLQILNERFEVVKSRFELITSRALEKFEAQMPRLIDLCSDSRQAILFLSKTAAEHFADRIYIIDPGWKSEILLLPESRERALLLLHR